MPTCLEHAYILGACLHAGRMTPCSVHAFTGVCVHGVCMLSIVSSLTCKLYFATIGNYTCKLFITLALAVTYLDSEALKRVVLMLNFPMDILKSNFCGQ